MNTRNLTKAEAIALAEKEFGQFNHYVRNNCIIVRDKDNTLVTIIYFHTPKQLELFDAE